MKSGLESLQGVSDASRCIAETLLKGIMPERQNHKSSVRTTLKRNFRGSYGQIFSVEVFSEEMRKQFRKIGRATFAELTAYYLNECIYHETRPLSDKAKDIDEKLGETSDELIRHLRMSTLRNIHSISSKFNYDLKVRYRQSREAQIELATFNENTATVLDAVESDEKFSITARITRLNINTGNGRLQIEGEDATVAFGFKIPYRDVDFVSKRRLSENLNLNNGLPDGRHVNINLTVSPMQLYDETVVKYMVYRVHGD